MNIFSILSTTVEGMEIPSTRIESITQLDSTGINLLFLLKINIQFRIRIAPTFSKNNIYSRDNLTLNAGKVNEIEANLCSRDLNWKLFHCSKKL